MCANLYYAGCHRFYTPKCVQICILLVTTYFTRLVLSLVGWKQVSRYNIPEMMYWVPSTPSNLHKRINIITSKLSRPGAMAILMKCHMMRTATINRNRWNASLAENQQLPTWYCYILFNYIYSPCDFFRTSRAELSTYAWTPGEYQATHGVSTPAAAKSQSLSGLRWSTLL